MVSAGDCGLLAAAWCNGVVWGLPFIAALMTALGTSQKLEFLFLIETAIVYSSTRLGSALSDVASAKS
jgi:hypothetical protein